MGIAMQGPYFLLMGSNLPFILSHLIYVYIYPSFMLKC